jgi:hypothetical protein
MTKAESENELRAEMRRIYNRCSEGVSRSPYMAIMMLAAVREYRPELVEEFATLPGETLVVVHDGSVSLAE